MTRPTRTGLRAVACAGAWPRPLRVGVVALAMAAPTSAWPVGLSELLATPLEQLLRLEISAPGAAPRRAGPGAILTPRRSAQPALGVPS